MANMPYCRFENTYRDLKDCYNAMSDESNIEEFVSKLNESEKKYYKLILDLCRDITDDYCETKWSDPE